MKHLATTLTAILGLLALAAAAPPGRAQNGKPQAGSAPVQEPRPPAGDLELARKLWPKGLRELSGRWVFSKIASPGGLQLRTYPRQAGAVGSSRKVDLEGLPAEMRRHLKGAELVIGPLEGGLDSRASSRESPSKRGHIRHVEEASVGRIRLSYIPGVGEVEKPGKPFSGKVLFVLEHTSHSNPSPSGVRDARETQEATWGPAFIDYADLTAIVLPPEPAQPAAKPGAGTRPAAPPRPVPEGQAEDEPEVIVLNNCRVMRSGTEIIAYVEWETEQPGGTVRYFGSILLTRRGTRPAG